jgi:dynein heavy chain
MLGQVQATWMYLRPVMTAPDILKHLAVEGAKFKSVDDQFMNLSDGIREASLWNVVARDRTMLRVLQGCRGNLEIVLRGLTTFQESKRMNFPRFFFLSNDELL